MTTRTIFTYTQSVNNSGDTNFSYRVRVPLTNPGLDQFRITVKGSTAAIFDCDLTSLGVWDGSGAAGSGNDTNMKATPVPFTWTASSLSSFSIAAATVSLVSNWVNLNQTVLASNSLIVAINLAATNGNSRSGTSATGTNTNYWSATDSASLATKSSAGLTTTLQRPEAVFLIETQSIMGIIEPMPVNIVKGRYKTVAY